ncbi:ribosomal protein [Oryctes borbonicus]|uniref:Ribosomal protein n=1 Tax=Oryctes borbonicus TaxID=1629725 RepID=A0A0T6BCH8_9SCAR|nr:ribosomal protein [Oryctes borbonicus]
MCISKLSEETCKNMNRSSLGRAVRGVLAQAKIERRLICGLYQAIVYLEENAEDALLCLLPESRPGDVTAHMQTVLLQAFCYENCIPVITVDSSQRLATLCGITSKAKEGGSCACAVVTRDPNIPWDENGDPPLSPGEKTLQDFYECTIEEFPRPVVQLPV